MLDRLKEDINAALRSGDKKTASALRLLFSSLKNAQIDNAGELSDEEATKAIKKEIKKRVEARDLYSDNGREEQASQEEFERSVYASYVPEELSMDAIDELIVVSAQQISDLKFSSLMPEVMKQTKGQADGRLVSERVKKYLEQEGK